MTAIKIIPSKNPRPPKPQEVIKVKAEKVTNRKEAAKAIHKLNKAIDQVKRIVLERSTELNALKLCIVTGQHMMLEGRHGVAKSMMAEEVCKRIRGANFFEKILMKGTQPDEIFGPMNSEVYRKEARWEHNTKGHLPEAHFVFLDEVYRGSDSLLGSLMGMLNERKFHNGTVVMNCPLITAIGTTNFQTDVPELEAFHDRWLVQAVINPLGARNLRTKMLQQFLDRESLDEDQEVVLLDEILCLQKVIGDVVIDESIIELYDDLVQKTLRAIPGNPYFSDRRNCLTLRMVVAEAILSNEEAVSAGGLIKVEPQHLLTAAFGLTKIGDKKTEGIFEGQFQSVVGDYERLKEETKTVSDTQKYVDKLRSLFDPKLDRASLIKLHKKIIETSETIENLSGDELPKFDSTKEKFDRIRNQLYDLKSHIESIKGLKINKGKGNYTYSGAQPVDDNDNLPIPDAPKW